MAEMMIFSPLREKSGRRRPPTSIRVASFILLPVLILAVVGVSVWYYGYWGSSTPIVSESEEKDTAQSAQEQKIKEEFDVARSQAAEQEPTASQVQEDKEKFDILRNSAPDISPAQAKQDQEEFDRLRKQAQ